LIDIVAKSFKNLGMVHRGYIVLKKIVLGRIILVATLVTLLPQMSFAQNNTPNSKIFINSCIYGTMTGTLLGLGSLAFTDNPGDKLQRVFRGASLGLYAGIFLGAYLIYGVTDEEEQKLEEYTNPGEQLGKNFPLIYPIITDRGFEGVAVDMTVLRF